jgi:hypothetical protein
VITIQIELPDQLYEAAKRVAAERDLSLAVVIRQGVEYITQVYRPPGPTASASSWELPAARALGEFMAPERDWRELGNTTASPSSPPSM